MSPIYARDLNADVLNDAFMGAGFEEMLKKANAEGKEVVVGHYLKRARVEE